MRQEDVPGTVIFLRLKNLFEFLTKFAYNVKNN